MEKNDYDEEIKHVDGKAREWFKRPAYQTVTEYMAAKYNIQREVKAEDCRE